MTDAFIPAPKKRLRALIGAAAILVILAAVTLLVMGGPARRAAPAPEDNSAASAEALVAESSGFDAARRAAEEGMRGATTTLAQTVNQGRYVGRWRMVRMWADGGRGQSEITLSPDGTIIANNGSGTWRVRGLSLVMEFNRVSYVLPDPSRSLTGFIGHGPSRFSLQRR